MLVFNFDIISKSIVNLKVQGYIVYTCILIHCIYINTLYIYIG